MEMIILSLMTDFQNCQNESEAGIFFIFSIIFGIIAGIYITLGLRNENNTYKKGQIDAIQGIIKYEKKENEDGEMVWQKIDKK